MPLHVQVATDDPTPVFEQVRRQLITLIAVGALPSGARLPPVRQLAADLGIAPGTVSRAYQLLEASGHVRTRRGGGTTVAQAPTLHAGERAAQVEAILSESVLAARRLGASDEEITHGLVTALNAARSGTPTGA